ncbi:hypothetical protein BC830DRAFT_1077514 [Chytriomyces sp. MP71]|nr:hypothetical protein BC830DRAFT_1077514 [Chytriomyces sp. MP71]
MTPEAERKAIQNRQAQKAFRERKKQHMKDLEKQVAELSHLCRVQTNNLNRSTTATCNNCYTNQKAVQDSQKHIRSLEQAVTNLTQQNTLLRSLVTGANASAASELVEMPQQQQALMSSLIQPAGTTSSRGRGRFHTFSDPASLYNNKVSSFEAILETPTSATMDASIHGFLTASSMNGSLAMGSTLVPTSTSVLDSFVAELNTAAAVANNSDTDTSIMGGAASLQASPELGFANLSMPVKPYRTRFPSVGGSMAMNAFLPSPVSSTTSTPAIGFLDYATLMSSMHQQQQNSGYQPSGLGLDMGM